MIILLSSFDIITDETKFVFFQEPEVKQAIYLIFCVSDEQNVNTFISSLKKKTKLSILTKTDIHIKENSWLHDLSQVMQSVLR